ncbi:MAG: tetratricopeptide repeat protein [Acidobacteriaceae bacterium]
MPTLGRFAIFVLLAGSLVPGAAAQAPATGQRDVGAILQRHYDAAQRFQSQGNLQQAAGEYRLFLGDALTELALGEAQLGDYAKAAPYFDGALALEPNSPQVRLDYARAAMDFGDLDHAHALAQQLVAEEAGNPKGLAAAHEVLGRTLLRMNEDQQARKELETAVALNPDFTDSYNLAVACLDMDDDQCADRVFTSLEAAYGDTPQIHMEFGRAWGESDFQPRAEAEFQKVIAEDPKFPEAHYCLAATYLGENVPSKVPLAEKELQAELAVTPNDFLTYAALGKLAVLQQKYAEAARYLSRAIQLNPKSPDAWLYQGQMQYNQQQSAQAEKSLRQAIQLTTDPSRNHYQIQKAYYLLGRILMREGKQKEATAQMQMAQKYLQTDLSRDQSRVSGMQGRQSQGLGGAQTTLSLQDTTVNADPAAVQRLAAFQKQIAPVVADSYNNLGVIAASGRDFSAATSWFQSAAEWNPAMPGLNLNWGRAAFAAGRFGDAVMPLTAYLKSHPSDTPMREALGISDYMVQDYRGCVATLQPLGAQLDATPQVSFLYAESLVKTGQAAVGIQRLTALEKAHPDAASVHLALGQAWLAIGKAGDAVRELETAVRLAPRDPQYHHELARAYQAAGRTADADRETRAWQSLRAQTPHGSAQPAAPPVGPGAPSTPN